MKKQGSIIAFKASLISLMILPSLAFAFSVTPSSGNSLGDATITGTNAMYRYYLLFEDTATTWPPASSRVCGFYFAVSEGQGEDAEGATLSQLYGHNTAPGVDCPALDSPGTWNVAETDTGGTYSTLDFVINNSGFGSQFGPIFNDITGLGYTPVMSFLKDEVQATVGMSLNFLIDLFPMLVAIAVFAGVVSLINRGFRFYRT